MVHRFDERFSEMDKSSRRRWIEIRVLVQQHCGLCSYFPITIWDCMDIVDYLDYAGHVMLIVMFDVVVLCSLED